MKKVLFLLVAFVATMTASAQFASGGFTLDKSTVYYGLRFGMNVANVSGEDVSSTGSRVGMNGGVALGLRVSKQVPVFVETGLYYSGKGCKTGIVKDITLTDGKVKTTTESLAFHNIEIPLLIKYGVNIKDQVALLPFFGPYFGIGVGGNGYKKIGDERLFKRFDTGFKLGCGVEYNMLYAELGYAFGVNNVAKNWEIAGISTNRKAHSNTFFLNVGVNF